MAKSISNFGGNLVFQPGVVYQPTSADEILDILNRHRGQEIRAVGSLHSWSQAPVTDGVLLELHRLTSIEIVRSDGSASVIVGSGCKVKHLIQHLAAEELTLPSLGLIDEQSIAGATATGTHGSGKNSLSHYIESVSIAHYEPETGEARITVVDSGDELKAARCSLGLMGIIVSLQLRCRGSYRIEEHARMYRDLDSALALESRYPQQQFYLMPWSWRYFTHHRVETKERTSWLAPLYRAYCFLGIDVGLHLLVLFFVRWLKSNRLVRFFYRRLVGLTVVRGWRVVEDSPATLTMQHELFRHIEIEVFVQRPVLKEAVPYLIDVMSAFADRDHAPAPATLDRLEQAGRKQELLQSGGLYHHHYPIAIRRILADDTLISMAAPSQSGSEDWYAISLISYHVPANRAGFLAFADFIGETFAELFQARSHWGKYNPLDRQTNEALYPNLERFRTIVQRFDPDGVFGNDWLKEVI